MMPPRFPTASDDKHSTRTSVYVRHPRREGHHAPARLLARGEEDRRPRSRSRPGLSRSLAKRCLDGGPRRWSQFLGARRGPGGSPSVPRAAACPAVTEPPRRDPASVVPWSTGMGRARLKFPAR
jgi:hypothetical protein